MADQRYVSRKWLTSKNENSNTGFNLFFYGDMRRFYNRENLQIFGVA
jgi:hypothetical protein